MANSIEQNKVVFKEQYPDAPDDAIQAWATIKYHEDVKAETVGYKDDRRKEYLPIQDQLDMQYWDSVNGTTTWKDHIAKVKSDNPKP